MDIKNKASLISVCIDLEELSNSLNDAMVLEGAYETDDMLQDVVAQN